MLKPLLQLYNLLDINSAKFLERGLMPVAFIDVYRSQPLQPELYEYYNMPAIFVDYSMSGNGIGQRRTVQMTLHVLTDELPDASNISEQRDEGLKRFLYQLTLQEVLEGSVLGKTTALKFLSENTIDAPVINYHAQMYQFDCFLSDMAGDATTILGEFERLNIFGSLRQMVNK